MYAHSDIPRSEPSIFVEDMHNSTDVEHVKKTLQSLGKIAKVEFKYCGKFKQALSIFVCVIQWVVSEDVTKEEGGAMLSNILVVLHRFSWDGTNSMEEKDLK